VAHWLAAPGVTLRTGCAAHALRREGARWQVLDATGTALAEADSVVLANAHDALRMLCALGLPPWPTTRLRGQTTVLPADLPDAPALPQPLAAGGYALQLSDGRLLCGATSQPGDDDPQLRAADHADNLAKLARLTGWTAPLAADDPGLGGRVGWRLATDDRLPLIGPVPVTDPQSPRIEQPRQVPRIPGLWLLTALGSRGITQAALAGELLAAWITESPWPVPASLVDAVDPARFVSRAARRSSPPGP
jgi:tRNA 5-methylaminomethyl-2-thiouridine biosynthesis bifunctional protein